MQSKWSNIDHTVKTANAKASDEGGDPTGGGLAPAARLVRSRGRKWENDKEKREWTAAKMIEKFEDIVAREEASAKLNELKEEKKAKMFNMLKYKRRLRPALDRSRLQ